MRRIRSPAFRDRFHIEGTTIYLDGNSMGRLPKAALSRLQEMAEHEWGTILVRGWTESGWMESPLRVGDRIGELIGASPGEVIVADTTSIGLLPADDIGAARAPAATRHLTERSNFPTDLYIAQGVAELLDCEVRAVERGELHDALDGDTALLTLTEVDFRTGERHDMGGAHRSSARRRCAGALGSLALRRCHRDPAQSSPCRPRRGLHVQIPQCGPRFSRVCLRLHCAPERAAQPDPGMAGSPQPVPVRRRSTSAPTGFAAG